ncbi:NUDIX hydrolase [Micromonospora humida]|uniref:NUDIX domain-containing protein n=1 Tax=Micromonospora humida TaxID=2809018 RepID=A0ABS2J331_9ACTN|nr:NUDIX domain-containing protein [Micromonospora humida]MBM7080531.1 NUDIX domain-containing protein [Micromonospora humida]
MPDAFPTPPPAAATTPSHPAGPPAAGGNATLHADAVAVLTGWTPTGPAAEGARDRTLDLLADGPVALTRHHLPGHLTASALILDAAGERVLLCLHGKLHRWVQLGGHCEPGDATLAGAALREATEESGIPGLVIDPVPIDVDIHPVRCQGGSLHHDVRFAVFAPPGAVEQVSDESEALGWFPTDRLPEPLAGGTAKLVAPALAVRARQPR